MKTKIGSGPDGRVADAKRDASEDLGTGVRGKRSVTGKVTLERESQLKRKALELLKSPNVFRLFLNAMRRLRLVGESSNALVLYIVALSSLLDRPLNAIVKGASSSGKNFLVTRVLKLIPESAVQEITSSSKTAWNYGQDSFRHKIVYLQERNDAAGAVHPVRLLISENKLVRIVTTNEGGVRVAKRFVAEGPISSISTTTRDRIETDDETRHLSLWMDESTEQTRNVNQGYIAPETPLTEDEIALWHEAYHQIEGRTGRVVVLPIWFKTIAENVFDGDVAARRYFPAFVEACRATCLLRSFQSRSGDSKASKIEVSFADYAITAALFEDVFVESLHRNADKALGTCVAVQEISKANGGTPVDADALAEHLSVSADRAYGMLRDAVDVGLIRRANAPEKGNLKAYLPAPRPRFVPDPADILAKIPQITALVEFIHPLTGERIKLRGAKPGKKAG